jgi:hypothetical protein
VVNKRVADTQRQAVYPGKTWLSEPAFDQGKPISFVEVPSLPDWLASSPNQLTQVQDQITGQIDLQNIASTAAAATVQQMVDQNTASRGDVSRGFNDSDCRLAVRLLCLDRKFYTEPRELTYRSDTGENTLKGFVASRELPRRIDFYIEAGAPKTADQNAAMINNWIAQGWVPPNVGILAIQKNQPELVTDPIEKNVSKQQRENQQIMGISEKELRGVLLKQAKIDAAFASQGVDITEAGPPPGPWPMPNQFDNDEIHMSQMESWFLTPEFELLGPSQQQVALWHYEAHKQAKMQKEMEAQNELNERAAMLGQNNAASAGQDKLLPSQPGIPQSAETQAAPQPVER